MSGPAGPRAPDLLLDGRPGERLGPPPPGRRVLRRDPFAEAAPAEPFFERLEARRRLARGRRDGRAAPAPRGAPGAGGVGAWLERWLDAEDRRRLAAVEALLEPGQEHDPWGLSPEAVRRTFPLALALYRGWFRVRSRGHEHLPEAGGAVLAANHAGLLPFDGAMLAMDVLRHSEPPRLTRALVDPWARRIPGVSTFFARTGQVEASRENVAALLRAEQLVLVFPEGMAGVTKPVSQRYRLQRFHRGFVREALRAGVPIVPVALAGSDDQAPILFDVKPLARLLGLPVAPVTPTFPWLGPAGLLPYPVRYRILYGAPLRFHERHGPDEADDARLVDYLARRVRRAVQALLDRAR